MSDALWASSADPELAQAEKELGRRGRSVEYQGVRVKVTHFWSGDRYFYDRADFLDFAYPSRAKSASQHESHWQQSGSTEDSEAKEAASTNDGDDLAAAQALIVHLRAKGKQALRERDEWRDRAIAAEQALEQATQSGAAERGGTDDRFRRAKRVIAQKLHPDNAPGSAIERAVRGEIFKEVWGALEEIERGQ